MTLKEKLSAEGLDIRRRERPDGVEFVADLGAGSDAAVDVVGEMVIVVTDDQQHEIDDMAGASATMNNGVVTITMEDK
jgi:hypothetical protein